LQLAQSGTTPIFLDFTAFPTPWPARREAAEARPDRSAPPAATGGLARAASAWPEVMAAAALVGSFFLLRGMALHHDAVWQLWIGRQLHHGATLYRDIIELNPPLWFWLSVPLAALAEGAQARPGAVLVLFFVASAGLALALARRLLPDPPARRGLLYAVLLAALLVVPLWSFGQRDHFALIASLPYVALIAGRAAGKAVPLRLALAIGLLAAAGFGLKHYFLIVPLAVEAWHLARARRLWRPWRPELVALGGALLAYLVAILIVTPDYPARIVPMIRAAYGGYDRPLWDLVEQPALGLWLLAGLGFALRGRRPALLAEAALVASLAFLAAYLIQHKGWSYQLVPAVGMLVLAAGAELAATREARPLPGRRTGAAALLLAVVALPAGAALWKGPHQTHYRPAAERALAGLGEGQAVMVLSAHASSAWPMVEERRLRWASRHYVFWMLPAIAEAERSGRWTPALRSLADDMRRDAARDAACAAPALILIDTHRTSGLMRDLRFDTLAFFRREPAFEAVMRRYRLVRRSPQFDVHARIPAGSGAAPGGCRRIR
jgi:hypothetical protein